MSWNTPGFFKASCFVFRPPIGKVSYCDDLFHQQGRAPFVKRRRMQFFIEGGSHSSREGAIHRKGREDTVRQQGMRDTILREGGCCSSSREGAILQGREPFVGKGGKTLFIRHSSMRDGGHHPLRGRMSFIIEGGSHSSREGAILQRRTLFVNKGGRMPFFKRGREPFVNEGWGTPFFKGGRRLFIEGGRCSSMGGWGMPFFI